MPNAFAANAARIQLNFAEQQTLSSVSGSVVLTVTPPFDGARVAISIDGASIGVRDKVPYEFSVDLGPAEVEHRLLMVATDASGRRRKSVVHLLNSGKQSFTIALRVTGGNVVASVTAPANDPLVTVVFFDGDRKLITLDRPPFEIPSEPRTLLFAVARSAAGIEVSDFLEQEVAALQVRTVPLLVTLSNLENTRNLKASDFRILDGGREAELLEFSQATELPISMALVLDASASMTYEMKRVGSVSRNFLDELTRPGDSVAIFSIHDSPKRELALTSNRAAIDEVISKIKPGGRTALHDALLAATRELAGQTGRRAIVVLSDGDDTASMNTVNDAINGFAKAGLPLYVVSFNQAEVPTRGAETLRSIAVSTGGLFLASNAENLRENFRQISRDLRGQYSLRYKIAHNARPNEWRKVRVSLRNAPGVTVRTIEGYFTQ